MGMNHNFLVDRRRELWYFKCVKCIDGELLPSVVSESVRVV